MFKRFFSWLFGKKSEFHEIYHPRERLIYSYWNGQKEIHADPMILYKRMMAIGPDLSVNIKVATSRHSDAGKAHDALVAQVRDIFQVKSLDEGGLTELETVELLDDFLVYNDLIKKNSSPLPILPEGTPAPTAPLPDDPLPTPNGTVSGSTASAPVTAPPSPLPSELP